MTAPAFHAVASDYDGTLAEGGGPPSPVVLQALAQARAAGIRIVLVTGRILSELRADFPDVDAHVDAIVAENGGVLALGGVERLLAPPVDESLVGALRARGIDHRCGRVLVACDAVHDLAVLAEIRNLGLDYQLVHNRGALMILPPGISKGTGLFDALGEVGVSYHNTVGLGDAENDHSLLDTCELGVAVANAVPALKAKADLVLSQPDGEGVAALLHDLVVRRQRPRHSTRWKIAIGEDPTGAPVSIPASQLNVLIAGGSGEGKSYFAGLMAERLIAQGYSVLVVDPEGDHLGLARLRGALVVGSDGPVPPPEHIPRLFRHRFGSVILDLSQLDGPATSAYLHELPAAVEAQRAACGLPHWVIVDEAHSALGRMAPGASTVREAVGGFCLVTYRPHDLAPEVVASLDVVVALRADAASTDVIVEIAAGVSGLEPGVVRGTLAGAHPGEALVARRPELGSTTLAALSGRTTRHVRHWHKYTDSHLPAEHRFFFRSTDGRGPVAAAGNLAEFAAALQTVPADVVEGHLERGDFSRWIYDVVQDHELARQVAAVEGPPGATCVATTTSARQRLGEVIRERYLT